MAKSSQQQTIGNTLFNVAWMSVLLGVGMELLLLIVAAGFGKSTEVKSIVADLVQKISWASFVCMGVAVGTAATKMRPAMMGLAGLISGPVAFNLAKILHKSISAGLGVAGPAAGVPSAMVVASLKGLEYAVLGLTLGALDKSSRSSLKSYILIGFLVGLSFGGILLYLTITQSSKPPALISLVSKAVNEIIFPVGCSLVIFAAQKLGKNSSKLTTLAE